jgi:hypothetical protein
MANPLPIQSRIPYFSAAKESRLELAGEGLSNFTPIMWAKLHTPTGCINYTGSSLSRLSENPPSSVVKSQIENSLKKTDLSDYRQNYRVRLCLQVCLFLGLLFISANSVAQGEANNWYFGENAGLDFNSGSPMALTDGQVHSIEGSAVMSDANGNLLFYTDGATVWNRNHQILLNGAGLLGELSSTQSALIIQKPGSTHIYYIFTTSQAQRFEDWVFCYSEVDMNLDGGLGGITSNKNVQLFEPIAEKITAVKHANGQDIWVLTHDKFTNKYLSYLVTNMGVNTTPIVFTGGSIDNGSENIGVIIYSPNRGQIKASPDGTKIACAFSNVNKVDLLDFNNATGQFTYRFTINQVESPYAVEFSPNNSLLYVTGYNNPTLRQYNLTLSTPAQIIATSYNFPNTVGTVTWGMQMGPDEKIYLRSSEQSFLNCIQYPNGIGLNCIFTTNAVPLNGRNAWLGFPNFPQFYLTPSGIEHTGSCVGDTTFFSFNNGQGYDSIVWNFGNPNAGPNNSSNEFSPSHIYQSPGNYSITATYFINGQSFTVSKSILIIGLPNVSLGPDTFFCSDNYNILSLDIEESFSNTIFSFGEGIFRDVNGSFFVWQEGNQWLTATNGCGSASDTFFVDAISAPLPFVLPGDQNICEGSTYGVGTAPAEGNYLWQDGSTEPIYFITEAGEYHVTVSNQCGSRSDTMQISVIPLPIVELGNDTSICLDAFAPFILFPQGIFDFYTWQNSNVFGPVLVNQTETYVVNATNVCGVVSDTVHVRVDVSPPLAFSFGEDTFICEGETFTVSIDQPGVSYWWNDGGTDSLFSTNTFALIIGSAMNECGQQSDTLQVFYFPIPDVDAGPDVSICNATEISLTAISNSNTYLWQNGSTQNTLTVNEPGWYWVSTTNNCGTVTDSVFVQLGEVTEATLILNSCDPIWVNGISYNESGTFTQTLVNISGCDSILTIQAEILNSTTANISISDCIPIVVNGISYSESGTYTQTLENGSGCDSILTIEAEIQNFNAQIFQTDTTLYFNGNPTNIQWFSCLTGQIIPGENNPVFVPQQTGNYGAIVTIGECTDTSNCRLIPVPPLPQIPPDLCENIRVAPNPVSDQVSFLLDKETYAIRLFSPTGALIWQKTGTPEKQIIDFRNYAPALYVLEVDQCRFKIVKQ